ncbi:MAG: hypothetical protein R3D62_18335 [Xanthobacteraceae bacterium]
MVQEISFMRVWGMLVAATLAFGFAMTLPAFTATPFDGEWSVVIRTHKGDCERAYRAPITISNGRFINVGVNLVDVSGNVRPDGRISVRVSRGEKSAVGSGRLTPASGNGSWKGGACAGTWTAQRRG